MYTAQIQCDWQAMHTSGSGSTESQMQHPDERQLSAHDLSRGHLCSPLITQHSDHLDIILTSYPLLHTLNHGPRSPVCRTASGCIQEERPGKKGQSHHQQSHTSLAHNTSTSEAWHRCGGADRATPTPGGPIHIDQRQSYACGGGNYR